MVVRIRAQAPLKLAVAGTDGGLCHADTAGLSVQPCPAGGSTAGECVRFQQQKSRPTDQYPAADRWGAGIGDLSGATAGLAGDPHHLSFTPVGDRAGRCSAGDSRICYGLRVVGIGGRYGVAARLFDLNIPNIQGYWGAVIALALYTYPYLFLNLRSALLGLDSSLEESAQSLGYSNNQILLKVVFPH